MRISLAAARVNAKLTQDKVAKSLKISKSTIVNWEKGKTSPDGKMIRELEKLYNMPFDYIFLPETLLKVE